MNEYKDGLKLFKEGYIEDAIEKFQEAIELDDQNPKIWNALGVSLMKKREYSSAETCFNNALLLDSTSEIYSKNLNKCLEKLRIEKNSATLLSVDDDSYQSSYVSNQYPYSDKNTYTSKGEDEEEADSYFYLPIRSIIIAIVGVIAIIIIGIFSYPIIVGTVGASNEPEIQLQTTVIDSMNKISPVVDEIVILEESQQWDRMYDKSVELQNIAQETEVKIEQIRVPPELQTKKVYAGILFSALSDTSGAMQEYIQKKKSGDYSIQDQNNGNYRITVFQFSGALEKYQGTKNQ